MADPTPTDAQALALLALATAVSDERRARRFLDLTGIGTDELRNRAADPVLLAALIRFLEAYEPDLVAVAEALGVAPAVLVAARRELEAEQ
jgi:adenine/guanine phosphoribosyltransferase-like PRPP-binding protein